MKRQFLTLSVLLCAQFYASAQIGNLDSSFGKYGIVSTDFLKANDQVKDIAIQSDGKIVAAGFALNGLYNEFALARYQKNGNLDSSFGNYGKVRTDIGIENDEANAMVIQTDGKIVLAGNSTIDKPFDFKSDFALVRYKTNGTLDSSFGINGKVKTVIGFGNALISSMSIQADGKLVVSGYNANGSGGDVVLARYNTNGTLDNTFSSTGIVITDFSGDYDFASGMQLQSDGKIVISGSSTMSKTHSFFIARYLPNGTLDNTFGSSGSTSSLIGVKDDGFAKCALQTDGKIISIGYSWNATLTKPTIYIMRYLTNGTLDNTFGTSGRVILSFGTTYEDLKDIVLQADGKIVVVGSSAIFDIALARLNTNGSLDTTFGSKGKVITSLGTFANAQAVTLQTDKKIVIGGVMTNPSTSESDFLVARYFSSLTLGVVNLSLSNSLLFYPNPIQQEAFLEYTLDQTENISIRIADIKGNIIASPVVNQTQRAGNYKQSIVLPQDLAAGYYFITLASENGKQVIKVVK